MRLLFRNKVRFDPACAGERTGGGDGFPPAKAITDVNFQGNQSRPDEQECDECDLKNREIGEEIERK
jgi:hypothetical protein